MFSKFNKLSLYLVSLIVIVAGLRFIWLDIFPVGMYHDEIEYLLSAKRYALFGSDLSGVPFPESVVKTDTDGTISPVPPILLSPIYLFLPLNQFTARLPYVIISLLTAWIMYLISQYLFKKKTLSLIVVLIFLINPWSFYLSRYAADTPFALLFYLAGIYTFLKYNKWGLIFSLSLFVLGFFSYHGAKPLLIPILIVLGLYKYQEFGKKKWGYLGIFILGLAIILGLFGYFSLTLPNSGVSVRSEDIFFLDRTKIASQVDTARQQSIVHPLTNIFINYYTTSLNIFTEKYLTAFSPEVMFMTGDPRATYRFENHGLFYLSEILLMIFGLVGLYIYSKRIWLLVIGLILVAPITTAISSVETSVINRSFMLLPLTIMLISSGIYLLISSIRNAKLKPIFVGGIIFIYLLHVINFGYFYFFKFPVTHQESFFLSEKIISKIINPETTLIFSKDNLARAAFLSYVFYSDNQIQKDTLKTSYPVSKTDAIKYQGLTFQSDCEVATSSAVFIKSDSNCQIQGQKNGAIIDQKDAGEVIKIYNSSLCKQGLLEGYKRFHYLEDYQINQMSEKLICQTWIKK